MRRTIPRLSYYVSSGSYYLPVLFPECFDSLNQWIRHVTHAHRFTTCSSFALEEDSHMIRVDNHERYFVVFYVLILAFPSVNGLFVPLLWFRSLPLPLVLFKRFLVLARKFL